MCKLAVVTGKLSRKTASAFIAESARVFHASQRDGFGFVAGAADGHACGRYLDAYNGFRADYLPELWRGEFKEEGALPASVTALVCHGRTSTNKKALANVHPFHRRGVFLAHNGVLSWRGAPENEPHSVAGCDSDSFLSWLLDHPSLDGIRDHWSGYGAVFTYAEKTAALSLMKDDVARLFGIKRARDGWVFATDEKDLARLCRVAGIATKGGPVAIPSCLVEFDARGEISSAQEWEGFGIARTLLGSDAFKKSYGGGWARARQEDLDWTPGCNVMGAEGGNVVD